MNKKIISFFLTLLLISFSFFYTNKIILEARENDPIMIMIKEEQSEFETKPIEAISNDNYIIPGISGLSVDVGNSYNKMKSIGKYDRNLLVFEEVPPSNSIKDNYDNYIISGNKSIPKVSLVVIVEDVNNIEGILKILNSKEVNATFFLDKKIFDESIELVKLISSFGNDIELLSDNYSIYEVNKYNSILRLITKDKLSYCYLNEKNDLVLKNCKESKLQSIIPSIITNLNIYGNVKNNLDNGSIISINNSTSVVRELKSTISYIYQKGKNIVLLNNLLIE